MSSPPEMPNVMRAFVEQASPPLGYGNDYMVWDWKIALTILFYLPYALVLWKHPAVPWLLFGYSLCAVLFFAIVIRGFKEHMAYESNPFDFVKVQFLLLLNVVVLLGLAHWSLSLADPDQYNRPLDAFSSIYFSVVTIATLGYGDIHPTGAIAKAIAVTEIFFGIWFFITVVPVAVADQAERIRHYRDKRKAFAEATKAAWNRGQLKPVEPPNTEA
jgi:hypothetical protein